MLMGLWETKGNVSQFYASHKPDSSISPHAWTYRISSVTLMQTENAEEVANSEATNGLPAVASVC